MMKELNTIEPVVKSLLLVDPDKTNFLLAIETNMVLLSRAGDQEAIGVLHSFKKLYLEKKLANPASIVRVARKLREKAREGKETDNILPSSEREEAIANQELRFKTYSLEETMALNEKRDINDQMDW